MNRMKKTLAGLLACAALLALLPGCGGQDDPYGLQAARIQADTEYLSLELGDRPTGTEKEVAACDWLQQQLEELGFAEENGSLVRTAFDGYPGMTSENLVAVCNGGGDGPILCVMAHYDSVEGCPGARDNGSSVAVLLELARYLGRERQDLNAEVRLLFLGSEENGYHGATAYVQGLSQAELARHRAAFNLENSAASPGPGAQLMFGTQGGLVDGEYRQGNYFEPMENSVTRAVTKAYRAQYGGDPPPVFHMGGSDHLIFHQAGIEAANVCWKFMDENGMPTLSEYYHQPYDTPEGMDFDDGVVLGSCVLSALYTLADSAA